MVRKLNAEERALWHKVVATVRPFHESVRAAETQVKEQPKKSLPQKLVAPPVPVHAPRRQARPGTTLDASWDRRLARGLVQPDFTLDLHGHNLETAYRLLDRHLEHAIESGARLLLLITGKPPVDDRSPIVRGAIRAAVDDWLYASRHAASIAAVRNAHRRHGGAGALYIILRQRRPI